MICFKNHYYNKAELIDNFERMIKCLENFPEIQKKIVEDGFNFTYMDRLASGLKQEDDYLR